MLLYPSLDAAVQAPLYFPMLFLMRAAEDELPPPAALTQQQQQQQPAAAAATSSLDRQRQVLRGLRVVVLN